METGGDAFGGLMAIFVMLCVGLPMLIVFLASVIWSYRDAEKRGKSGCLVAALVFLATWPVGLIIWLIIRPDDKAGKF